MTTETNAEFLERMKRKAYTKMIFLAVQVDMPDLKRLIQQAELAQELERKLNLSEGEKGIKAALNDHAVRIIEEKESENVRLREALEFYAEKTKYMYTSRGIKGHPKIIEDEGRTAHQALKGESE